MGFEATKVSENDLSATRGKGLSVVLWILQGLLAALFLFSGAMKFVMPVAQMTKGTSLTGGFIHFIGICEILGGIGLVVPALLRILPVLTPIAACGLVIIMAGATYLSLPMGKMAVFPAIFGLLLAFVAYGRFRLRPVEAKGS
jgi:uncharacterized membrane protein YphA (DoxX/SURF4 family)